MDFKDQIKILSERVVKLKDQIATEEATKTAFIMPFIQMLGYDIFNPMEVIPEYICDIGTKKGEKIDYAIFKDGEPVILIECKHCGQNLNLYDGQLLRYFHVSKAKFGILTNGVVYKFYSDIVEANKMDEKPFLEFNITDIKDNHIDELRKFHKSNFNAENITNTASELKYLSEIRQILLQEFNIPSQDFVKHIAKQVYSNTLRAKVLEQFSELTKRAIQSIISDIVTERLNNALKKEKEDIKQDTTESIVIEKQSNRIETTTEELEAYLVIKSIIRQKVDYSRIYYRDFKHFFTVLLDDSIRKTICKLYFDDKKKKISFTENGRTETKIDIDSIDDIFKYSDKLFSMVELYDK